MLANAIASVALGCVAAALMWWCSECAVLAGAMGLVFGVGMWRIGRQGRE